MQCKLPLHHHGRLIFVGTSLRSKMMSGTRRTKCTRVYAGLPDSPNSWRFATFYSYDLL
jgi:hypothetical protein